jgi:hypothetical protein
MNPVKRELRIEERKLLEFLLRAEFLGAAELRAQANHIEVSGECECGCGSIDLHLRSDCPSAKLQNRIPVEAGGPDIDVLLFTKDGFLSLLEIVDYMVPPRHSIPRPEDLQLWVKPPFGEAKSFPR